jgi:CBS domain-containing protein
MRTNVVVCEENTPLRRIAEIMINQHIGSVLINSGEKTVGIITMKDLLRAVLQEADFMSTKAKQIMSSPVETCRGDITLEEAIKLFEATGKSRLVVIKEDAVVGILKRSIAERFKGVSGLYQFSPKTRSLPYRRGSGSTTS